MKEKRSISNWRADRRSLGWGLVIFTILNIVLVPVVWANPIVQLEISEIMYDLPGADTDKEWVELTNSGSDPIQVVTGSGADSWRFFDTANHTLTLSRGSSTIAPGERVILTQNSDVFLQTYPTYTGTVFKVAMSLPNSQASLKLSLDKGQTYLPEQPYQSSLGGAGNGETLEWFTDHWQPSGVSGGTPGQPPHQTPQPSPSPTTSATSLPASPPPSPSMPVSPTSGPDPSFSPASPSLPAARLTITEIAYDPPGSDQHQEWLEVENTGPRRVTIPAGRTGSPWRLSVNGQNHIIFAVNQAIDLDPGNRVAIVQDVTSFKEHYPTQSHPLAQANFSLPNQTGLLRLSIDSGTTWISERTYQASDGAAGDGRTLEENKFGQWTTSRELGGSPGTAPIEGRIQPPPSIRLSEFLPWPNPGAQEWIELENFGRDPINLAGWQLDDQANGGSKPFTISENRLGGTILAQNQFLVFGRDETHLSLSNTNDSVRLLDSTGQMIETIFYNDPPQGASSINSLGSRRTWTTQPTPGGINQLVDSNLPSPVILPASNKQRLKLINLDPLTIQELPSHQVHKTSSRSKHGASLKTIPHQAPTTIQREASPVQPIINQPVFHSLPNTTPGWTRSLIPSMLIALLLLTIFFSQIIDPSRHEVA